MKVWIILLFLTLTIHANLHVVVLGSSTAYGEGASSIDKSWVGLLTNYVNSLDTSFKVTNLAKQRITSYHILPTGTNTRNIRPAPDTLINITKAISLKPTLIIINLPSNDIVYKYDPIEQCTNFKIILESTDIPIYVTTTQPINASKKVNIKLKKLRDNLRNNFYGIDFWKGLATEYHKLKLEYDSGDGVHLNDKGHNILFERIRESNIIKEND